MKTRCIWSLLYITQVILHTENSMKSAGKKHLLLLRYVWFTFYVIKFVFLCKLLMFSIPNHCNISLIYDEE